MRLKFGLMMILMVTIVALAVSACDLGSRDVHTYEPTATPESTGSDVYNSITEPTLQCHYSKEYDVSILYVWMYRFNRGGLSTSFLYGDVCDNLSTAVVVGRN